MTANCGTSFSAVVSICTHAAVRAPLRLTNTNAQIIACAVSAGSPGVRVRAGTKLAI